MSFPEGSSTLWCRAAILATLLLAGCGFQMRGASTVPPEMARTYIDTTDRHSLFYRELSARLRLAGVEIVDRPDAASSVFSIVQDVTGQRVLSVSARNVPTEFEVYYSVSYRLISGEQTLMPMRNQTLTRDYTWNETLVLGKEKEEQILREDIVDNLIRVILIQLSSI